MAFAPLTLRLTRVFGWRDRSIAGSGPPHRCEFVNSSRAPRSRCRPYQILTVGPSATKATSDHLARRGTNTEVVSFGDPRASPTREGVLVADKTTTTTTPSTRAAIVGGMAALIGVVAAWLVSGGKVPALTKSLPTWSRSGLG
jgi:hypothetical protein